MKGGFIQFPILAIIAILVIGAGVGTAVVLRNQAVAVPAPQGTETQSGPVTATVLDAVSTTTKATADYSSEEIETLRREVEALKAAQESSGQTVLPTAPPLASPQPTAQNLTPSIAEIVGHWRFFTAKVESAEGSGSGFVIKSSDGNFKVLTNRHVVEGNHSFIIRLPGNLVPFRSSRVSFLGPEDFAVIFLGNSDEYLKNLLAQNPYEGICAENKKPILGDEIVILGYPGAGSKTDVTLTEGIISGFERNYFITDAKVNPGNSGGVAISVKNNCYFGIPTYANISGIEALGRIFYIWKVMGQF